MESTIVLGHLSAQSIHGEWFYLLFKVLHNSALYSNWTCSFTSPNQFTMKRSIKIIGLHTQSLEVKHGTPEESNNVSAYLLSEEGITVQCAHKEVLSIMEAKGLLSPLLKCECLTLDTDIRKKVLPGIAHMLDSSRNLETLVISSAPYHCHEYFWEELCNVGEEHYWTSTEKSFTCLMFRLQKVKLIGFGLYKVDYYLPFVQFLLKNARVLQKMVIDAQTGGCNWPKEFSQAAQKLLSFPRSSPNAVVLFYE